MLKHLRKLRPTKPSRLFNGDLSLRINKDRDYSVTINDTIVVFSNVIHAQRLQRVLAKSSSTLDVEVYERRYLDGFIAETKKL